MLNIAEQQLIYISLVQLCSMCISTLAQLRAMHDAIKGIG